MSRQEPHLGPPTPDVRDSFLAAVSEFQLEGRDERTLADQEFEAYGDNWDTPAGFAGFVAAVHAQALEETPRPVGIVPQTTLWWTGGTEYYGRGATSGIDSHPPCMRSVATSATPSDPAHAARATRTRCFMLVSRWLTNWASARL